LRFFELYQTGDIKYYSDMKNFKGAISIGPNSIVRKTGRTTLKVQCE
jgi:hypothetical protein